MAVDRGLNVLSCIPEKWIPAVFEAWRKAGIRYVVLRNYEGLPAALDNDLDILIDPARMQEAEQLLKKAIRLCGGRVHNRAAFSPVSIFFHDPASCRQYHVDLFHNLVWRGCVLMNAEEVLRDARLHNDIPVPSVKDEAVLNFLTRLLYGGYVRDKYKTAIQTTFNEQYDAVRDRLVRVLGPYGAKVAEDVREARWDRVEQNIQSLRRSIFLQNCKQPARLFRHWVNDGLRLFKRAIRPPGITMVLMGPDGCGKTSVGVELKKRLAGTFYEEYTQYIHWKPRLLGYKAASANPFGTPCTDPHGKPARPPLLNALYFLAHVLEIPPAWWLRIRPKLFRNMLVMIDRYYYDFMVDPRRYRLFVSERWAWLMYRFVPKPDLVFCLTAPAEVIQGRKQEVTLEETERQRARYEAVARRLPYGHVIHTDRPLEEVVDEVERVVLDYLSERLKRFGHE